MRLSIILFLCCHAILYSQNLMPNPSFEEINDTISGFTNSSDEFIKIIKSWIAPNPTTPDVITPDFDEGYI